MIKAPEGRIIAQLIKEERKTQSGLYLPEESIKDVTYWKAIVTDSTDDSVNNGDLIVIGKYAGSTLYDNYISVVVSDILGVI